MRNNHLSKIALLVSILAILLSSFTLIKVLSLGSQLSMSSDFQSDNPDNSAQNNAVSTPVHDFDESLVGEWSDSEWSLQIMEDSTVYFEQESFWNNTKPPYLKSAPRLLIGYIENSNIIISYTSDCTMKEYMENPDAADKKSYYVTVSIVKEAKDSIKIGAIEWLNNNYSFRRVS